MGQEKYQAFNRRLASALIFGGLALAFLLNLGVYLTPAPWLSFIDSLPLRWLIAFLSNLLIIVAGLSIYVWLHIPPAKRLMASGFRAILAGGFFMMVSPFGCVQVEQLRVTNGAIDAHFTTGNAVWAAVVSFAFIVIGVCALSFFYSLHEQFERVAGSADAGKPR